MTTMTSMDSQEPTCCDDGHLLASKRSRCEHAAYLIRRVLEALNSTEDGLTNVWQLDAPLRRFAALISSWSRKGTHGRSTLQVCQRGGWALF